LARAGRDAGMIMKDLLGHVAEDCGDHGSDCGYIDCGYIDDGYSDCSDILGGRSIKNAGAR